MARDNSHAPPRRPPASDEPILLEAIRVTIETLEARARIYRWAAVAVVASGLVPLMIAIGFLSWRPLPGISLMVPIVGTFLLVDGHAVLAWQRRILEMWISQGLRLVDLREAVLALRHLPTGTVTAMLDRLSAADTGSAPDEHAEGSVALKRYMADADRQHRSMLRSTTGATLLACSVAAAMALQAPAPLIGAALGLLLATPTSRRCLSRARCP